MGTENAFVGDIKDLPHPLDLLDEERRRRAEEDPGILAVFDVWASPEPMPSASEAAEIAGYQHQARTFRRRFKEATALAYRRLLVRYKAVLGPALIARGVPYDRVAEWLGFGDPSGVRRMFGRVLGQPPSSFRT